MSVTNAVESQLCVDTRGFLSNSDDEEMVTETSVCAQDVTLEKFYDVVMALRNAIRGLALARKRHQIFQRHPIR